jgi:hypothetical protein
MTRWNLSIPDETDRLVRMHLSQVGMKKGDLSTFVAEAVRSEVLRRIAANLRRLRPEAPDEELREAVERRLAFMEAVEEIRSESEGEDEERLQADIDEAVAWVRAHPA